MHTQRQERRHNVVLSITVVNIFAIDVPVFKTHNIPRGNIGSFCGTTHHV